MYPLQNNWFNRFILYLDTLYFILYHYQIFILLMFHMFETPKYLGAESTATFAFTKCCCCSNKGEYPRVLFLFLSMYWHVSCRMTRPQQNILTKESWHVFQPPARFLNLARKYEMKKSKWALKYWQNFLDYIEAIVCHF